MATFFRCVFVFILLAVLITSFFPFLLTFVTESNLVHDYKLNVIQPSKQIFLEKFSQQNSLSREEEEMQQQQQLPPPRHHQQRQQEEEEVEDQGERRQKEQQQQQVDQEGERRQKEQQHQEEEQIPQSSTTASPYYYTVFSSGCSLQQHWESYLFFYFARKVQQPGNVTRIASGCDEKQASALVQFHQQYIKPMSPFFHLHLTPDYQHTFLENGKHPYKYMNKPYGLRHWMEEKLGLHPSKTTPSALDDSIVILMDPDMILLRPIVHDYTNETILWADDEPPVTRVVRHGFPIAQQDGYLNNEWMHLNASYITKLPPDRLVPPPKESSQGPLHWNAGPPYLATVRDMYQMTCRWTEYAPRVLEIHPVLFAEMYGLIIAAHQLELPFTLVKSLVVSVTETNHREGWLYIDNLPKELICANSKDIRKRQLQLPMPVALHYCQRYWLGNSFFSKYRVKKTIMNCDQPLLEVPKQGIHKYNYTYTPPRADLKDSKTWTAKHHPISKLNAKREAFMLCHMTSSMNEALRFYKSMACDQPNLNETLNVYTDPSDY